MAIQGHVRNGVIVPDEPVTLAEGAEVRIEVIAEEVPTKWPRQGGQWKGNVRMADDFDEWPDDIAEAFGMYEP